MKTQHAGFSWPNYLNIILNIQTALNQQHSIAHILHYFCSFTLRFQILHSFIRMLLFIQKASMPIQQEFIYLTIPFPCKEKPVNTFVHLT